MFDPIYVTPFMLDPAQVLLHFLFELYPEALLAHGLDLVH